VPPLNVEESVDDCPESTANGVLVGELTVRTALTLTKLVTETAVRGGVPAEESLTV
jgi:hypothetical protein